MRSGVRIEAKCPTCSNYKIELSINDPDMIELVEKFSKPCAECQQRHETLFGYPMQ